MVCGKSKQNEKKMNKKKIRSASESYRTRLSEKKEEMK